MNLDIILEDIKKKIRAQKERENFSLQEYYEDNHYQNLKRFLIKNYSNQKLGDLFSGESRLNSQGKFYVFIQKKEMTFKKPSSVFSKERLFNYLSFLEGVREITAGKLREKGYVKVRDLVSHARFHAQASRITDVLEKENLSEILYLCNTRFRKTHPAYLFLSCLFSSEDFLFLDIETLGLFSGNIVFLVGVIKPLPEGIEIIQYFARSPEEEGAVLEELIKLMNKSKVLVTYNGKAFDYPYIEHRAFLNNLFLKEPFLHIDLLHFTRRYFNTLLGKFTLTYVEKEILGRERFLDLPGEYVALLYKEYLQTRSTAYLLPLVIHNHNDLVSLVELLNFFYFNLCE